MKSIDGYDAKIFTDDVEPAAIAQIQELLSVDVFRQCKIRIMPDVHVGKGCVIGFTGDLGQRVIPNIVGVDIGCGMRVATFRPAGEIDFHAFHEFILKNVPSGTFVRDEKYKPLLPVFMDTYIEGKKLAQQILCYRELKDTNRVYKSMGTLGGGNHFIELDRDETGLTYLVVHTGSRNLGKQIADIYQNLAIKCMGGWDNLEEQLRALIAEYKAAGRRTEIQGAIKELKRRFQLSTPPIPEGLCYVEGAHREEYLHDMRICQQWAVLNRRLIVDLLLSFFPGADLVDNFESVHNYIGEDNVIRKGAISAREGERCIIPLNMRDGSLICRGKGNADWNYSAPHGAGRVMSRTAAAERVTLEEFAKSMEGIYSESVCMATRDEAPMVYKPAQEIIDNITPTCEIEHVIKPIFNYKDEGKGIRDWLEEQRNLKAAAARGEARAAAGDDEENEKCE